MKNFFIGFLAGIGNIIPGLSGSALLIVFGIYENILKAISNILKTFKKNFIYLFPIGLGIIIGTFLFSNIIKYFLDNHLVITSFVFTGLLLGTIPSLFIEASKEKFKKSYLIYFIITFLLGINLLFFKETNITYDLEYNFFTIIKLIFTGFILACSTIIPGISSTVLLNIAGMYGIYINAINTVNLSILIPILIGLIISGFFLAKLINYLLKNYYGYTFYSILGFTIATIPGLLMIPIAINITLIISIILGIIAFLLSYFFINKFKLN